MTDQRKAMKVTVVPARSQVQQVVVRPQGQNQANHQIFIRQAPPQSVVVRQQNPANQHIVLRQPSQQPLVVRPQTGHQGQIGHIRITPDQLASLTANTHQQIVVRSQQVKSPARPQQFIIKTSPASQPVMISAASPVHNLTQKQPIVIQKKTAVSSVKNLVVGGSNNAKLSTSLQSPAQSVVTYIKQKNINIVKSLPVNTQGTSVRLSRPATNNIESMLSSSNVIKLGANHSNLSPGVRISATPSVSLPTVPVSSAILQLDTSKPPVTNITNNTSPVRRHVVVNTIQNSKSVSRSSSGQISLLSPTKIISPKPLTNSSPKLEGLQLVTADGKFINAQGLHLLSPNGTVVKAENVLQNISLSPEQPARVSETAQQLISNIQQPVPFSPGDSISPAKPPPGILSSSPPPLPVIPKIMLPTSPVKEAKDLLLTKAVSPSKILPPPPSLLLGGKGPSIDRLLPTQPLLPSQLKNLTPVSRTNNLPTTKKPARPRAKSKKEQQKAKMQKLESNLNVQQILSVIDKKFTNNHKLTCNDSEVEREYLTSLEKEARGEVLTAEMVSTEDNYYRLHKVCRYIDLNNFSDDSDQSLSGHINDSYLHNMMKKHLKRKRRKQTLLNVPDLDLERGQGLDLKMLKGTKGRGRANRSDKTGGAVSDQASVRRHKLWLSIMKKEVSKAGKARNYNSKEKMANAKRLATGCMRVQRVRAMESQRAMKEAFWRAKRLTREMQAHWKKYEREEKQQKKAKEKAAQEQRKHDIELLEAKRQQRKLNFLITQTELYAHFMAGKLGHQSEDTEKMILSRLESDVTDARLQQLDDYDEVEAKAKARESASIAAEKQENMKRNYDEKCGNLNMSEAADHAGDRPQPSIFQGTLKTYQLKGMNWLCSLYDQGINGILADEMGLGKTVQALSFLAYVAETYGVWGPFLVITPASTLHNWQQEIARFVPDFKCIPYWGSPQDRKVLRSCWTQEHLHTKKSSFHIVVTSYQIVITDYKYFTRQTWMYMVLDEAQAIKSASSQRWKMLLDFKCRGRLLLSGTPIQNTMAELWSLLHFVMPALFDSHEEFKEWFSKDIEGHAEGTKGKVDEKQMSRLHLILKPFMLRRIKKDVEHELTEKVEVLVYCPLTIRQKLLYTALKQNLRMEELLAGLGLGNATSAMGVSSLMNLVMQFRKVCNHPELFERREPKSPLVFNVDPQVFPKLPFLDKISSFGESSRFNIFRSDSVNRSLTNYVRKTEYLEVSDSPFSFLRLIQVSPGELERQHQTVYHQYLHALQLTKQRELERYNWSKQEHSFTLRIPNKTSSLPSGLVFLSPSCEFLSHQDARIIACPETISHRIIRSRRSQTSDGVLNLLPEFVHSDRPDQIRRCEPRSCPKFLMDLPTTRAASLPFHWRVSSRAVEYETQDQEQLVVRPGLSARSVLLHGSPPNTGGVLASTPALGWSGITIPDRHSLISDGGKLYVLDGLLARLKEGGHRVLIYSQMTRMIDLLEEYMSHRQHSYMRLDGSSKIHERRDMVADFQTRQDIFVFLLSTRAGGLGINLTAADTVIFYDSDWNPTVDQQAMDRAHRLGQTRQVTVYRLICKGTIEERILQRAREKSEIHRMVIQGGSFKGKAGDLKPKEVVSLLLDDDEIENRVKVKIEEEVEKETEKKKENKKAKKRAGGNLNKENGKKARVEEEESGTEGEDRSEDPKSLFDFAGDKMGPKKAKGRGGGKRGRPRGSGKGLGRRDKLNQKKSQGKGDNFSLESLVNDSSGNIFGFYNQM